MIETDDSNLRWVERAACHDLDVSDFFVDAGHVISSKVRERCRTCPVRQQCVTRAYTQGYTSGYFGGISPGERRSRTLQQALQHVDNNNDSGDSDGGGGGRNSMKPQVGPTPGAGTDTT